MHAFFLFPRNVEFPPKRGDFQRVFLIGKSTIKSGVKVSILYFGNGSPFKFKDLNFYPIHGKVTADPSISKPTVSMFKDLFYFAISAIFIIKRIRDKKIILYAHTPLGGFVGMILKLTTHLPLIYDPHDWHYDIWAFYHSNLSFTKKVILSVFYKSLSIVLLHISDVIICVSDEIMNVIKGHKKILIPNFVEYDINYYDSINNVTKSGTVLFAGHISFYQGIIHLIKAFEIVEKEMDNAELIVIGDGEDLPFVKHIIHTLNLKRVKILGAISHEKVIEYIKEADVCVAPFVPLPFVNTSCPLKLLEYMAMGKKIVVTDIPGFRKMLHGYNNVWYSSIKPNELARSIICALKEGKTNANPKTVKENIIKFKKQKIFVYRACSELYDFISKRYFKRQ